QGIGYRILTSAQSAADFMIPGEMATVYTEMIVREDAISLVGFSTREERKMFNLLTSVSGVGTRVGINVLSSLPYERLGFLIASGDVKALTSAQGIGKKTAERIILELKDKIGSAEVTGGETTETSLNQGGSIQSDVTEALMTLGYTRSEAQAALSKLDLSHGSVEQAIRDALNRLMSR
ncbi:MAG: holliday junction helicase RuvA, partial [Clostridiales bacterium]|nr:holliday junction helicase RuvA [Clostridiales bacterium]